MFCLCPDEILTVTSKCLMELYFYSHVMMYSSQQWKFYKRLAVTGTGCKFSKINLYFTIFKCTSTTTSVSIRQRWPVSSMLTVVGTVVAGKWAIFARSRKKNEKKKTQKNRIYRRIRFSTSRKCFAASIRTFAMSTKHCWLIQSYSGR